MDFISLLHMAKISKSKLGDPMKWVENHGYAFKNRDEASIFHKFVYYISEGNKEALYRITDNFIIGYTLPRISKEMDLLRVGENYIINVELKQRATIEKQTKQINQNNFYLRSLCKMVYFFSYNHEEGKIFYAISNEKDSEGRISLKECSPEFVRSVMENQIHSYLSREELDKLFSPEDFLVSPFNNLNKFSNGEYFLTDQQNNIKSDIIQGKHKSYLIFGHAGTGKSLLLYDIAMQLRRQGVRLCVISCALLGENHSGLIKLGIDIRHIRAIDQIDVAEYDYIFFDEFQRINRSQRDRFICRLKNAENTRLVVFMDPEQTLTDEEKNYNNGEYMKNLVHEKDMNGIEYTLSKKFRSNPKMAKFIVKLFKHTHRDENCVENLNHDIEIVYFSDYDAAKSYLNTISGEYKVLGYTTSKYNPEPLDTLMNVGDKPHNVIGQEYPKVAIPLDESFYYKRVGDGETYVLVAKNHYYSPESMLYQNITRVKHKLKLVIINNVELFERIQFLLKNM